MTLRIRPIRNPNYYSRKEFVGMASEIEDKMVEFLMDCCDGEEEQVGKAILTVLFTDKYLSLEDYPDTDEGDAQKEQDIKEAVAVSFIL